MHSKTKLVPSNYLAACYQQLDENGNIIYVNERWLDTLGYKRDEVIGHHISEFVAPDQLNLLKERFENFKRTLRIDYYDYKLLKKDGKEINIYISGIAEKNAEGAFEKTHCLFNDFTEEKKYEQELRELSDYIESIREKERTLLAREVHDELGQALTALQMDISFIKKSIEQSKTDKIPAKLSTMQDVLSNTIEQVKRITTRLRPGVLDHLGLFAAIEWQAKEFEERSGIQCELHLSHNEADLDEKIKTSVFRIFQEALTNVLRHSKATKIRVELILHKNLLEFEINDNGVGTTDDRLKNPKSFGLIGMRERVSALDGRFKIISSSGKGMQIKITLPL